MEYQQSIKNEVNLEGIGLHTGNKVSLRFKPLAVNSGINFKRIDLPAEPIIKADVNHILPSQRSPRRTSIGSDSIEIHTIEHLMAALAGLKIDNILIEVDNNEVPGLDGSSATFIDTLESAGIVQQDAPKHYFLLKEPIWAEEDGAAIVAIPAADYRIFYTLSYNHPMLKAQYLEFCISENSFVDTIAPSRTFCLEDESEDLRRQGLGKGANYDNTLVVSDNEIINNVLRFPDEFVRHKVLDLVGDLSLLGMPIKAHIIALRSGHPLNLKLVKKIAQQKERYDLGAVSVGYIPEATEELDASTIMRILPHRYPFLLVDRIISLEKGKRAVGIKNVSVNEQFFVGHFPGRPVMPGVLIVEAMAQVGGVLMLIAEENRGKVAYFLAADNVKFRKTVVPGDQIILKVEVVKLRSKTGQVHAEAFVQDKIVAEADLMFVLAEG